MSDDVAAGDHTHAAEATPFIPTEGSSLPGTISVPLAEPVASLGEEPQAFIPNPEDPGGTIPLPIPGTTPGPFPGPFPWPPFPRFCLINLRSGCYRVSYRPDLSLVRYAGTMRVDYHGGTTTISGDLYRYFGFPFPAQSIEPAIVQPLSGSFPFTQRLPEVVESFQIPRPYNIPIYPRSRYHSYLKVTNVTRSPIFTNGPCQLTLTAEQYVYTQPPGGQFNGTFPAAPGTRTVTIVLEPKPAPLGYTSSYFEGRLYDGGVAKGTFTMGWVSPFFRRATLEIDTLTGAVAPQAVGAEDFQSVFTTAGWDVTVTHDQTNIPVPWRPGGPTPNAATCWTSANLHDLMTTVRNSATNLDAEWRIHLVVVPATLGCGRGVMYDQIDVPREGVASFSDDGYPSSDSANFGTAANQQQRNVPRAFLRSACHEVGHGFNQIHQEQEGGADNSIMTTTPSVADVLGGPSTGAPGVFPDQINLAFNEHVRHHLVHFPDPVVRPGGMTFGSGHSSTVPEADRYWFAPDELELGLEVNDDHVELGEPLLLRWNLTNRSGAAIPVPTDVGLEAQHAFMTVTDPRGRARPMPSFVIQTDHVSVESLDDGQQRSAETRVFWSSRGFAFTEPGMHRVDVRIVWAYGGLAMGVRNSIDVWVNYPQTDVDNDAASELLHPEVGMYVALGGGADHLSEAVARIGRVAAIAEAGDRPSPKALRGLGDLMSARRTTARPRGAAAPRKTATRKTSATRKKTTSQKRTTKRSGAKRR